MEPAELEADIEYLTQIWKEVSASYKNEKGFGLLYSEVDFELRVLRDLLRKDIFEVLIDDSVAFKKAQDFLSQYMPKFKDVIKLYEDHEMIFDRYGVSMEVAKAVDRKVWLRSGGYLVIDETEALVVIDVNTGRYVGKKDLEDTIFQTNMEAVKEVAHQIRLRNASGIIVVDFIDMLEEKHREKVLETLTEEVKKDSVRVSVVSMTGLGLVEMTRKRLRPSLLKSLTAPCFYCEGLGRLKRKDTLIADISRDLVREMRKAGPDSTWVVLCHGDLVNWVYSEESELISDLEAELGVSIIFKADLSLHWEEYRFDLAIKSP